MRRTMRRVARATLYAGGFALLAVAGFSTVSVAQGQAKPEKVTICHAAGLAGTTHYETLTIGWAAVYGPAGHLNENGTPQAGHEQDYLGACVDERVDVTAGVTFRDPTCADPTAGVTYANEDKVEYAIKSGAIAPGETVKIKAEAKDGYTLVGPDRFEHTFGNVPEDCKPGLTAVTPDVTFVDPTCDTDADIIRARTEGVVWAKVGKVAPGETVTVTATAEEGYVIVGQAEWTHTFGAAPQNCETTTTTPPGPVCPPGTEPGAGKDGEEGNDNCRPITTTTNVTTQEPIETTETTVTTTTPAETFEPPTIAEPPTTTTPAKPKPKPKPASKAKPAGAAKGATAPFLPPTLAYTP